MSAPAQRSFAGGELAPALYARTDQIKYATGLRTCRNMIIRRHGGASNRPGTRFIQESKNSAVACRLIRFVRDSTNVLDTYVLEFGNAYLRFYQAGAAITTSGVAAWANTTAYMVGDLVTYLGVTYYCISAHTSATATDRPSDGSAWQTRWYAQAGAIYEIPTPYATADLADLEITQKGDVLTITNGIYAVRELTRTTSTRWVLAAVSFGPSIAAPTNVVAAGGSAGTIRYWAVTAIKESTLEESLAGLYSHIDRIPSAGTPTTLTWDQIGGAISYNVYRSTDGQTYGLINSAGGSPVLTNDTGWTDSNEVATGAVADTWAAAAGQCRNPLGAISATVRAYNEQYTVRGRYTLVGNGDGTFTGGVTYGRLSAYYSRDGEARVLAAQSDLIPVNGAATNGPTAFALAITVPDNGYVTLQIDVVPEVLPCAGADPTTATMTVDTSAGPDNAVEWYGGASGFSDVGDDPDFAIGPPTEPTLFPPGAYPATAAHFQQRRYFANTAPDPDTIFGSRIGSRASFAKSTPLQDDDMVQFSLDADEAPVVKHLLDAGRLLAFTTGGVFQCGSADDGSITPTTANPRSIDSNDCGRLRPLKVSDSVLFVEGRQTTVRDLQPWQAGGALGGYSGKDLTVFAAHLFEGYTLVDWAYAKKPHSIVYLVRSDGTLLGLTYLREQEIWAWHRHDTDGVFENVCVVPEGSEDAVYVVVRRTINGATKRYVERFASRVIAAQRDAVFMDASLSYDGRNAGATTMTLSGGTDWTSTETLTVTRSVSGFTADNVGDAIDFTAADGSRVRLLLEAYVSGTVMTGHASRDVPAELQGAATTTWTLAVSKVSGLGHLEGKALSILGDGYVVASPNNAAYASRSVAAGVVQLGAPYGVIQLGLPFIADLETLDLDSPGPRTLKDKKMLVNKVGLFVEASRGIWAGRPNKVTAAAPLTGLQEQKPRSTEAYDTTPATRTEYFEITIDGSWDNNGGVLVRQVDPIPMTILAAVPIGSLAGA